MSTDNNNNKNGVVSASMDKNKKDTAKDPEAFVFNACNFDHKTFREAANHNSTDNNNSSSNRKKQYYTPLSSFPDGEFLKVQPMSLWGQLCALILLALSPPMGIFLLQGLVFIIGKFIFGNVKTTFFYFYILVMLPLTIAPQAYIPTTLTSWISFQLVQYFSLRMIVEDYDTLSESSPTSDRPRIYVAPPHGVFPYGNILTMLVHPSMYNGIPFRGLASSAALFPPVFKQILRAIGVVDASRKIARSVLSDKIFEGERNAAHAIGISTGGVAEVFETNAKDECIILKERIGLIKLAIRTGADLVPCYVLGNTKSLKCWAGEGLPTVVRNYIETISRKLGFALVLIYGRFGLALPYRVPIVGLMGKPIPTYHVKCEDPAPEVVTKIHNKLMAEVELLFERHKALYNWDDKKLIIK